MLRGGFTAPYSGTSTQDDYILYKGVNTNTGETVPIYTPPTATTAPLPGITGGSNNKYKYTAADDLELQNGFLYSLEGGCACNAQTGGNNNKMRGDNRKMRGDDKKRGGDNRKMRCDDKKRGGVNIALAPFISTLALLGARLISDKNSGINLSFTKNDKYGGKDKYRR
jgi:hypothetical protein